MIIETTILLSTISLFQCEQLFYLDKSAYTKYSCLYSSTDLNKNTIEYNTMTTEELIKINNEKLSMDSQ